MDTQFVRDRITQLRLKKGVSEYQMSYDLGHSRSYVYNISSGKSLPPMAEFLQICNYFDITPSQFFDESEENPALLQTAIEELRKLNPLSQKISCGHCGSSYRRKEQVSSAYWCCRKHDTSVKDCPIAPVAEESLYGAFCRLYYKLKHQSIPILEQMLTSLQLIRNRKMLWSPDIVALNKRISDLSSQNQTLAFLKQQGLVDPDIFIAKTNELTKQLRQVKLEKEKLMDAESDMTALQTRNLIDILEGGPEFLDSFDAELFGELVEKIIIESNDSVRFCLKNGLELRESIERTVR